MTDELCSAVHPEDVNLPDPIPEEWHTYRRVCVLPAGHPPLDDGLGAHASAQGDRWDNAPPPVLPNLPAPIGDASGQLDADSLRALAPVLRRDLIASLRGAATQVRQARGTVVVPEDTYDLVRRLTSAGESLRAVASAFTEAAKEADAIVEEEALAVSGAELDGVLLASLFVPDGVGQRIAVRADRESSSSVWDLDTLYGFVAEQTVADEGRKPEPALVADGDDPADVPVWTNDEAVSLVRDGIDRLVGLGKFTPGAKPIEALRKRLAEQQRDAEAGVIRQVRQVTPGAYKGVKITREEAK